MFDVVHQPGPNFQRAAAALNKALVRKQIVWGDAMPFCLQNIPDMDGSLFFLLFTALFRAAAAAVARCPAGGILPRSLRGPRRFRDR